MWTEAGHEKTLSVADIKEHGTINEDSEYIHFLKLSIFVFSGAVHFGCFHVSPDDHHLLYVAERKKPRAASFFSKTTKDDPAPLKVRGQSSVEGV